MEISQVRIHISIEELREIARDGKRGLASYESQVNELIETQDGNRVRLLPPSTTIAKPAIAPEAECPKCHLMFAPGGIGTHLRRKHNLRREIARTGKVKLVPATKRPYTRRAKPVEPSQE